MQTLFKNVLQRVMLLERQWLLSIMLISLIVAFPFAYPFSRAIIWYLLGPTWKLSFADPPRRVPFEAKSLNSTPLNSKPEWNLLLNDNRSFEPSNASSDWWDDSRQWGDRIQKNGVDAVCDELAAISDRPEQKTLLRALRQSSHILRIRPSEAWLQVYCQTRSFKTEKFDKMLGSPPESVKYLPRFNSTPRTTGPLVNSILTETLTYVWLQSVAVMPDGAQVVTNSGYQSSFWDLMTGRRTRVLRSRTDTVAISPNGQYLALGTEHGSLVVWDLKANEKLPFVNDKTVSGSTLAFSSDSRRLLATTYRSGDSSDRLEPVLIDFETETIQPFTPEGPTQTATYVNDLLGVILFCRMSIIPLLTRGASSTAS